MSRPKTPTKLLREYTCPVDHEKMVRGRRAIRCPKCGLLSALRWLHEEEAA